MCQKKQKKTRKDEGYEKPRHINAKPYKRNKSSKHFYEDDDENYNINY